MITLYAAMLVTLGFLIAALIVVVLFPHTGTASSGHHGSSEAHAASDRGRNSCREGSLARRLRDELHKLETKVEAAGMSAARESVEINRRDAKIQELTEAIADQKISVDEHENARRVLEQAILDRLPKVEQRLAETRKLLATRDREIRELFATSAKQASALEEAIQLNVQREKELTQLRVALDTRAVRNRNSRGNSQFDSKVALRAEIEALRSRNDEQASLIERLQTAKDEGPTTAVEDETRAAEIKRLTTALSRTESELAALKAGDDPDEKQRALNARIAELEAREGVGDRNREAQSRPQGL